MILCIFLSDPIILELIGFFLYLFEIILACLSFSFQFCFVKVCLMIFLIGFAFIEFEDIRDAEDAVRDMDGRYVCGVRIRVEMAKNSSRY